MIGLINHQSHLDLFAVTRNVDGLATTMLALPTMSLMNIVRHVMAQTMIGLTMIKTRPRVVRTVRSIVALGVM